MRKIAIGILTNGLLPAAVGAIAGSAITVGLTYFADQKLQLAEYQLREISRMQVREFRDPNGAIFDDATALLRLAALMPAEVIATNAASTKYYCHNQLPEECIDQTVHSLQALRKALGTGEVQDEVIETYVRAAQRRLAELPENVPKYTIQIPKSDAPVQPQKQ